MQFSKIQALAMVAEPLWSRLALAASPSLQGYALPPHRPLQTHSLFAHGTTEAARQSLWSVDKLSRCIVEASPDCIEVLDPQGNLQLANPTALRQLRSGSTSENEGEPWLLSWSDEAQETVMAGLQAARETGATRFSQWRPGTSGEMRCWDVAISRMLDDDGELIGLLASSRDITALVQAKTEHELYNRELIHRQKNLFALVNGLVTLSARSQPLVQPYASTLRDRFTSLARALEYLHPSRLSSVAPPPIQTLQALLRTLLVPYEGKESAQRRFKLFDGADIRIRDTAVTGLALVTHELATNAIKYGALSSKNGSVSLSCRRYDKSISLIWCENGGPLIRQTPEHAGFGSILVQRNVEGQLGGRITYRWMPKGLRVLISMPRDVLMQTEATAEG
ncbi:UNVERIFIED_ORG: PAS domain S-box-containing protein [Methylobacterium sp. SuP10 SLI 274]|uniref:PAS domain-containing protein n=1 Tax=Methylorubrum extorquens TaxID=408 RepID=UPI00209E4A82|nr:PAS domain-containing protein [Methylorubrum extorquens]MCP1561169.1 PAS domain S-box-containing protein [Methylorubrum extorquens]MDF9789652.1 PAS domain S-box-containing protein [Methylorubrum extorquens]MDF9861367.1 PAS domain S-box-containing protein [Methylorubrum pseudosasae]MDH6634994.1 PAS domain S-box-containing protein [Methylobacterium sp. SuP10 SLI 274]